MVVLMAEIMKSVAGFPDVGKEITFASASGSDYFLLDNADQRVSLIVRNSNPTQNASVTIPAGDGELSLEGGITVSVGPGKTTAVPVSRLESARVKVLSGADKGKVFLNTAVDAGGSIASVFIGILSVM